MRVAAGEGSSGMWRPFNSTAATPPGPLRVAAYVDLDLVGDALIKLPFVRALRHACPDAEICWIAGRGASAYGHALAPLVGGLLDRVIEGSGVGPRLSAALGPGRLDLLIDTQSHVPTTLALRMLRPRRFVSAAADYWLSGVRPPRGYRKPRRLITRLLEMLELAIGRTAMPEGMPTLPAAAIALAERLLPPGASYVAQAVGAGERRKAWPIDRHIALASAMNDAGHVPVLIVGPREQDMLPALLDGSAAARFPLQQAAAEGFAADPALTIALGARCAAAVAADCGGGHMLAASGTPLVALFGPTDPEKFAPWASHLTMLRAQHWDGEDMARIPVAAVAEALRATLATRGVRPA